METSNVLNYKHNFELLDAYQHFIGCRNATRKKKEKVIRKLNDSVLVRKLFYFPSMATVFRNLEHKSRIEIFILSYSTL